jgi:hypothetical protein
MSQPTDWTDRDSLRKPEIMEEEVTPVLCHWCGCQHVEKKGEVCAECEGSEDYQEKLGEMNHLQEQETER